MDNSCKPIPVMSLEGFATPTVSRDCDRDKTARAIYDEVSPKTVMIETGDNPYPRPEKDAKVGSGSRVNNGDEVLTNAHVGLSGSYLDVITDDGKRYHARLIKLDEINDLARFKVLGLNADPKAAVKVDAAPLTHEQELITYGHPRGATELWASTGNFKETGTLEQLVKNPDQFPDFKALMEMKNSPDPFTAKLAREYLASPRIHQRTMIDHGNSGGPSFDATENLRAVAADKLSTAHALFIPADKVKAAIEEPETKFAFHYVADANGNQKLESISRLDGTIAPPIVLKQPPVKQQMMVDDFGLSRLIPRIAKPAEVAEFRNPLLSLNYYEQRARTASHKR